MSKLESRRRKQLIVDPSMQFGLAKRVAAHWIVFMGLVLGMAFAMEWFNGYPHVSANALWNTVVARHAPTIGLMLLVFPFFVYNWLCFSNRLAGPIYRLRTELRNLRDGKSVGTIRFRGSDYWRDLADEFNDLVRRLEVAEKDRANVVTAQHLATPLVAEKNDADVFTIRNGNIVLKTESDARTEQQQGIVA